ncbi:hypothetical protein EJ110_NYTH02559 [Nymphaea thermarum]|nr:hypothetical protein EJ110_NYTH02559 [Nymphaea thermarum]
MAFAVSVPPQTSHSRFLVLGCPSGESILGHLHLSHKLGVPFRPTVQERRSLPCKAQSNGVSEEYATEGSSTRSQLDLLEQLTSSSSADTGYVSDGELEKATIREQLLQIVEGREDDFSLPLGKKLKASVNSLTISQKRNIKRQAYLDKVSQRNDSVFFATIGLSIVVPPIVILAVAISTGYVQLLP